MRYEASRWNIDETPANGIAASVLIRRIVLVVAMLCTIAAPQSLYSQFSRDITVYPPVLYSGLNVITITARQGVSRVLYATRSGWKDLRSGLRTPEFRVISGPSFKQCARTATFTIFVPTMNDPVNLVIRTIDCDNNSETFSLDLENLWNVYREDFGTVTVGATACHTFRVQATGGTFAIDSLGSPSPDFRIRYTGRRPPLSIPTSGIYTYEVCFTATKPGRIRMPIYVFLRRRFPAGGHSTFVVADTAYVNVIPSPTARRAPAPARPRTYVAQPPAIIIPKAPVVEPPRVIPDVSPTALRPVDMAPAPPERPAIASRGEPEPVFSHELLTDPTPHRVVLMPTARPIDSGRIFVSNYELAGWLAGYGVNDRLSLLGGIVYVPRFIRYSLLATAGGRYEVYNEGAVRGALGTQAAFSRTDLSSIVLLSPYAVASVGDDDMRASATLGYTWRRHFPRKEDAAPFNKQAVVLGFGGDYRIGHHWKVAAEAFVLQEADYQPLIMTIRYFDRSFAIDLGLGVDVVAVDGSAAGPPAVPVITGTWVW